MSTGRPVWMLRINPLARHRLADAVLAELIEEVAARSRAAVPLAEAASDDLYRLVPATEEAMRGRILALRRDIHNGRDLAEGDEHLPPELPTSVARWSDNHRRMRACQEEIRRRYAGALADERSALRALLGDGDFLVTLSQSAPGVYDAARRYRDHPTPDAKDRKAERALLQYLTRAMVRTSPYGRFTAVGLAAPDPEGTSPTALTTATARPHVTLDRALLDYVMGGLVPRGDDPLVAVPPSARIVDGKITFFQMGPGTLRRLSAPLNRQTKVLVDLLDLGPRHRSALATAMAEHLGGELADADRLVGLALRLGLLVTVWRGDEFVAEPVERALRDLSAAGRDRAPDGLCQLRAGIDRLNDPNGAPGVEGRVGALRQVERLGEELSQLARRPARLRVNEDLVLDPLLVDYRDHETALDDLATVAELLWTFDRMHVTRALVASALVERFGPGCQVPLVDHAEALVAAVYRGERALAERPDATVGPADGSLSMLAKVRQEALHTLAADLLAGGTASPDAAGAPGDAEVHWSPAKVAELVADVPERFRRDPASYAVVVQPDGTDLVLNDAYAGHGPMLSRFLHADTLRGGDARDRLRHRLHQLYGAGTRLCEDRGCHALGINAHPPILERSLDPEGWSRLRLAHDAVTDTVAVVDDDGIAVKVLALGAQLPELFPCPLRVATWLCSSGRVVLDLTGKVHHRRAGPGGESMTCGYPQLRVGRVVVARRRWYPGIDFPVAAEWPDDVDYLLALTTWRSRHGVPAEVMLKSVFDGRVLWESLAESGPRDRFFELRSQAKPQYVDLASAVMARVLPRLLDRRPPGCIEEARPALAGGGQATEWMIEMARPAGQPAFGWRAPDGRPA